MDDLEEQRRKRRIRDEALNTPNCGDCLHPMEPELVEEEAVWRCGNCGNIRHED